MPVIARELFDEQYYLDRYPDIAEAVHSQRLDSGWQHYSKMGESEGREAFRFDEEFYLGTYPLAGRDIDAGLALSARDHFIRYGYSRGYLSHAKAPRPDNAARLPLRFGGFWPDFPNALDVVAGKLDAGLITRRQAELLRHWIANGYVILESAIAGELVDRAREVLDAAYEGKFPQMRFECHAVSTSEIKWCPEINPHPAKALDIHYFSRVVRDLIFADRVTEFLGLLFDARPFASQSLGFLRGSAQEPHQDSAYVAYSIPRQFAASWIALEDVTPLAGELFYYVGSHRRLEDFLYCERYKSVAEATRLTGETQFRPQIERHVASLQERCESLGITKQTFLAKRGDVLIWHADLVHGGQPVSHDVTRKSIVTHYCPKHLVPLFMDARPGLPMHRHGDGHWHTSAHYGHTLDPMD